VRNSQPAKRAADAKRQIASVRRKYKVDVNKSRKLLPAEIPYVEDMVVVLKIAGYSRSQMAKVIGISKGQIKLMLDNPDVAEKIVSLRARLPNAAIDLIQGLMIEAVMTIADVMRTENDNKVRLTAAFDLLDRGGASKVSRQERHNLNEERTTFTDDGIVEALRAASPEVQEQAAQLIEALEKLLGGEVEKAETEVDDA
jgi:hypothetical protein